jgi:hypothetical protein
MGCSTADGQEASLSVLKRYRPPQSPFARDQLRLT